MNNILPIGSVVKLKNNLKKVMITGYNQVLVDGLDIWDYAGVIFPEGYLDKTKTIVFMKDSIEKVYFLGYQDEDYENIVKEMGN